MFQFFGGWGYWFYNGFEQVLAGFIGFAMVLARFGEVSCRTAK